MSDHDSADYKAPGDGMTAKQKLHRDNMIGALSRMAGEKYDKGCAEHGGDLQDKTTLELLLEIRDEAIDTFIYAQTAIVNLRTDPNAA